MPFDGSNLPISGGIIIAGLIYVGTTIAITGPTIGARTIEKSNWIPRCEQMIVQAIKSDAPELQSPAPSVDCNSIMSIFAGPDARQFCDVMNPLFQNPIAGQIEEQNRRANNAHQKRIADAAARANSRCSCSVNLTLENRTSWALVAGSFRLIFPAKVRNLDAQLLSNLSSPLCKGEF